MSTGSVQSTYLSVSELNERSRKILQHVVDTYLTTGDPVGSRTISRQLGDLLSPATIRNVMADLEYAGLLYAPHTSAGRLPTDAGLKMFVSGLLEIGALDGEERKRLERQCAGSGKRLEDLLGEASEALSGLTGCAALVTAPKTEAALKHIEFVNLSPGRALVVLVTEAGLVENRIIEVPPGLPVSALAEASNFISAHMRGRTLSDAREAIGEELERRRMELDELSQKVIESGLAVWSGGSSDGALIIRGQSHLLDDIKAIEDLDRIRALFDSLEAREQMVRLLDVVNGADGVQIFIGSENKLFGASGCSVIVAPYQNAREEIIGAIGVIGPTRINYARIIPMVDYTAKLVAHQLGGAAPAFNR